LCFLEKKLRPALGKAFLTSALSMTYTESRAVYTDFTPITNGAERPKLGWCLQRCCGSFLGQRLEVRRLPPPRSLSAGRIDSTARQSAVRIAW
jgi:hypothetical protein